MKTPKRGPTRPSCRQYVALFAEFASPTATHYTIGIPAWAANAANPAGTVVGFDAWDDVTLAAHYVCVPARVLRWGDAFGRALLSLNTATRPAYQGKGLFTKLAAATYEGAERPKGFECVYGVANANSTPGFHSQAGLPAGHSRSTRSCRASARSASATSTRIARAAGVAPRVEAADELEVAGVRVPPMSFLLSEGPARPLRRGSP